MEYKFVIEISVKSVRPNLKQTIPQVHKLPIPPQLINSLLPKLLGGLVKDLAQEFPKEKKEVKKKEESKKPKTKTKPKEVKK